MSPPVVVALANSLRSEFAPEFLHNFTPHLVPTTVEVPSLRRLDSYKAVLHPAT